MAAKSGSGPSPLPQFWRPAFSIFALLCATLLPACSRGAQLYRVKVTLRQAEIMCKPTGSVGGIPNTECDLANPSGHDCRTSSTTVGCREYCGKTCGGCGSDSAADSSERQCGLGHCKIVQSCLIHHESSCICQESSTWQHGLAMPAHWHNMFCQF